MICGLRGKEGDTVHKLLGFLVLGLGFMIGMGTTGCNKKSTTSGVGTGTGVVKTHSEGTATTASTETTHSIAVPKTEPKTTTAPGTKVEKTESTTLKKKSQ